MSKKTHRIVINSNSVLADYTNGNLSVTLYNDGTREISFPTEEGMRPQFPLNVDIRVSTKCAFGLDKKTGKAFCSFCHESATTDGYDADYEKLLEILMQLPKGTEIAIGCNTLTLELSKFLHKLAAEKYIPNLTVNSGHLTRDIDGLKMLIKNKAIYGLGVSYRKEFVKNFELISDYPHMVAHVIAGLDSFDEILSLKKHGVKKVLILGEKDFGFNSGKVNLTTPKHVELHQQVMELTKHFDAVSFDNLALIQLGVREKLSEAEWEKFYQFEHSFYIDATKEIFKESSRSNANTVSWDTPIDVYFKQLREHRSSWISRYDNAKNDPVLIEKSNAIINALEKTNT